MGTPNTYGEWHEPVQVPSAAGAITEIDASQPDDRVKFERLADEWLEQRPRGVDVAQMTRHHAYQAIIDIGADAVPWLLDRLAQRPVSTTGSTPSTRSPTRNRYNPNIRVSSPRWPKTGSPGAGSTSHRNQM